MCGKHVEPASHVLRDEEQFACDRDSNRVSELGRPIAVPSDELQHRSCQRDALETVVGHVTDPHTLVDDREATRLIKLPRQAAVRAEMAHELACWTEHQQTVAPALRDENVARRRDCKAVGVAEPKTHDAVGPACILAHVWLATAYRAAV
eukprot:6214344-Pleurochrysis_carterae.AAC.2